MGLDGLRVKGLHGLRVKGLDGLRVKGLDGVGWVTRKGVGWVTDLERCADGGLQQEVHEGRHDGGVHAQPWCACVWCVCVCGVCVGICVYVCVRACVCVRVCVLGGGESEVVRRELTKECAEKVVSR